MILSFLSAKSRQTSKSKISNKYLKPFPRNNTLKSVALAVALSVEDWNLYWETMGLISGAVTVHLSYVFGFEYANKLFSRGVALPQET